MIDEISQDLAQPNVINLERKQIRITANMTTTGLGKQVLVLKQGVLEQGRIYIVMVTVRHKGWLPGNIFLLS